MGKMRVVLVCIVFLLLMPLVLADKYDVDIAPTTLSVTEEQKAYLDLTITNNAGNPTEFDVYSPDIEWIIKTEPRTIRVLPKQSEKFTLILDPSYVAPGFYAVNIYIRPVGESILIKKPAIISVTPVEGVGNVPSLRVFTDIPRVIDPREDVPVTITLQNLNPRSLPGFPIKIRSNSINQDIQAFLLGGETKQISISAKLDPVTLPQDDVLSVSALIQFNEKSYRFDGSPVPFSIMKYGEVVVTEEETNDFLRRTTTITFTNEGNEPVAYTYTRPKLGFMSFDSKPSAVKQKGVSMYVWTIPLEPNESAQLIVGVNYLPVVGVITVLLFILVGYFLLRSPLTLKKSVVVINTREGGISELRVLIDVKNRSSRPITNTIIFDKVRSLASVLPKHEVGSVKPSKIVKSKNGTLLTWQIPDIDAGEERIIVYKIRSELSILGGVTLPVALAKFTSGGRKRKTVSNAPKALLT
jgi:hypothetical protein